MRCEEVQEYLAERLAGSLSDRLSASLQSHVRTHMRLCAECCEELEDFEEMQSVLQSIPVEPCDTNAMRARFNLLIGAKEEKPEPARTPRSWRLPRPNKSVVAVFAGIVVLSIVLLAVRHAMNRDDVSSKVSPTSASGPKPAAAIVRTGAVPEGIETTHVVKGSKPPPPAPPAVSSVPVSINGRVLFEDGSGVSDPLSLGEIALHAVGNSTPPAPTVVKLDGSGRFSHSIAADEYRFRVETFSQDYVIQSITAGESDLLKQNLKVTADMPVSVEIRVERRNDISTGRILGTVIEALTNAPAPADQVALCCFVSGPAERMTAPVHTDGTFEFRGVPTGAYTAELRGNGKLLVANPAVVATSAGVSGLKLFSASQLVIIDVTIRHESGERLPFKPDTSIVFTAVKGGFRMAAPHFVGNLFRITVPADNNYAVSVSGIAAGYTIQSIVDGKATDLLHGGLFSANAGKTAPARIFITLSKN